MKQILTVLMTGKKTRRFLRVVEDEDEDAACGCGDGCSSISSNNDSAYDYDGYDYYFLCGLNLSRVLPA
jgi:hypothetical protein